MRTVDTIWKLLFGALIGLVVLVFLIVSSVTVKLSLPTADLAYSTSTASSTLKIPNTNTNTTSTKPIITNPATTTISHSTTTKATSSTNTIINATSSMPKIPDLSNSTSTTKKLLWGAYVGDGPNNLKNFEDSVGKKVNFYAIFSGWNNDEFPTGLSQSIGQQGKTLIIFWEPSFGYDQIIDNSHDDYIKQFAAGAKTYGYPVILVPFPEMNLNEEAWGYSHNNNSAAKFQQAWKHVHDLFAGASNVKFGLTYNNTSIPDVPGNSFDDYYPGDSYVDYMGVDGFNFADPWQTFGDLFDKAISKLNSYNKPIIIFSMASAASSGKAEWIREGLGSHIKNYQKVIAWVWFNQGGSPNWLVDSDVGSLAAFQSVVH